MSIPYWVTPSNLGNINIRTTNFDVNPLVVTFHSDDINSASVTLLNGQLPNSLSWSVNQSQSNQILIVGQPTTEQTSNWTFRVSDSYGVADRTFIMNIYTTIVAPSWTDQDPNLGYATSAVSFNTYQLTATTDSGLPLSYAIISPPFYGLSIDGETGLVSLNIGYTSAPTPLTFTVRAQAGQLYSDLDVNITLLPEPYDPIWLTPSGIISTITSGQFLNYQFSVFNSSFDTIKYAIVPVTGQSLPAGITLTNSGLLYGHAPTVLQNTTYTFTVSASSTHGSTNHVMEIYVTTADTSNIFEISQSSTELGSIIEGDISVVDVSATSTRSNLITYSIYGGQIPPGMSLDKTRGKIVGFVEFQPVDRDYWFEIDAWDGTQHLITKYHLSVSPYRNRFLNVEIPIMGPLKDRWITGIQLTIDSFIKQVNQDVLPLNHNHPTLNLISGLNYDGFTPDELVQHIESQIQPITAQIGPIDNVVTASNTIQVFRHIIDPQLNSNYEVTTVNNNNLEVPSFNHWRNAITNTLPFVNAGSGSGAILVLTSNVDGGVSAVTIYDSGSGYYNSPVITTSGSGSGATFESEISIVEIDSIINSQGIWTVGEKIELDFGIGSIAAILTVDQIDEYGNLVSLAIANGGKYTQFPQGYQLILNAMKASAEIKCNLGIGSVKIISSGSGYTDDNKIIVTGNEILPSWQSVWSPVIPVAEIILDSLTRLEANQTNGGLSFLNGYSWPIDYMVLNFQGKTWIGTCDFDQGLMVFDNGTTTFDEYLEPKNVTFDQSDMTIDQGLTNFDQSSSYQSDIYNAWGLTRFDNNATTFDVYDTIFDLGGVTTQSQTLVKKIIRI